MVADPFSALADIVVGVYKERKLQAWCALLFQIFTSLLGTFLLMSGIPLMAGATWARAVGNGFVWCAGVLGFFVRRAPQLRGMMFVFPELEAEKELANSTEVIQRS